MRQFSIVIMMVVITASFMVDAQYLSGLHWLFRLFGFNKRTAVINPCVAQPCPGSNAICLVVGVGRVCLDKPRTTEPPMQGCTNDPECKAKNMGKDICGAGGVCVGCTVSSHCTPPLICITTSSMCGPCTANSQCTGGLACITGTCQACTLANQCTGTDVCINGACGPCSANIHCTGGQVCTSGACVACAANSQCTGGLACIGGTCQVCTLSSQCTAPNVCINSACAPCQLNSHCAATKVCVSNICQDCTNSIQCTTGTCVTGVCGPGCVAACTGNTPQCNHGGGNCFGCQGTTHAACLVLNDPNNAVCIGQTCVGCNANGNCNTHPLGGTCTAPTCGPP